MTKILLSLVAVGALSLAAFADTTPPSPGPGNPCLIRPGSGVEGVVERGPTQPIVRPGQKDTAPMTNTTIIVTDEKGKEVARTKTDNDGRYEFKLPVGKYKVVGPRTGLRPGNWTKEIEVKANEWQKLNIKIDTGIRTPVRPKGVALPVVHKLDLGANLPTTLTVKVGERIVFTSNAAGARFSGWKLDANGVALVETAPQRIFPPILVGSVAGKGKLEIFYTVNPNGPTQSRVIDLVVLP